VIFNAVLIGYLDLNRSSDLARVHTPTNAFNKGGSEGSVTE
jgi:hypothetical protein